MDHARRFGVCCCHGVRVPPWAQKDRTTQLIAEPQAEALNGLPAHQNI